MAGYDFVDPSRDPIMPLYYFGRLDAFNLDERICDVWLGPTGDHVYHFHQQYPVSPAIVGRPGWISADELDAGVVIVRVVATNPIWYPIIINSIKTTFSRSQRYYLNVSYQGEGPPYPPIPDEHVALVKWIESLPADNRREGNISFDPECDRRFLVKLALGFGAIVLGDSYIRSAYAQRLQFALWESDTRK